MFDFSGRRYGRFSGVFVDWERNADILKQRMDGISELLIRGTQWEFNVCVTVVFVVCVSQCLLGCVFAACVAGLCR